jgi:hypothetical protein
MELMNISESLDLLSMELFEQGYDDISEMLENANSLLLEILTPTE